MCQEIKRGYNNMRKKLLCLTMALAMLAGTGVTAQAEDLQGKDGWFAEFNGK